MSRHAVNIHGLTAHEAVTLINKNAPCDVYVSETELLRNVVSASMDESEAGFYTRTEEEAEA
jgi:hypothetical protein